MNWILVFPIYKYFYTPCTNELGGGGVYWNQLVRLSICPSVMWILWTPLLLQFFMDDFQTLHSDLIWYADVHEDIVRIMALCQELLKGGGGGYTSSPMATVLVLSCEALSCEWLHINTVVLTKSLTLSLILTQYFWCLHLISSCNLPLSLPVSKIESASSQLMYQIKSLQPYFKLAS